MKSFLLFIIIYQLANLSFSQDLIKIALQDKSKIIYQEPFKFRMKTGKWDLTYRMDYLLEHKKNTNNPNILTDSLIVKELCEKAKTQNLKKWSAEEFSDVFLISNTEYLNFREIRDSLKLSEKKEIKKLRKQINQFNNDKNKWRSFPLSLSRPIFTDDKAYALIAFNYGNNGGQIIIYKKVKNKWFNAGIIEGWAY